MYRSAVILIVALALVIILLLVAVQAVAVVEMLAVVDEAAGPVHVVCGDQARPAEVGMLVRAGERIRTGAEARAGLHWADGSRIELGPNSELVVRRCRANERRGTRDASFRLNLGEIWIRLRGALEPGSKFEVETPTIVAAVRGTIFGMRVAADGTTRLQVYRGEVQIVSDVADQGLASGTCATVGKGRFELQRMSDAEVERWRQTKDIVGPLLQVTEPASATTTSMPLSPVYGRTESAAVVTVNGERVEVSRKGVFRARARLTEGENVITVVASLGRLRTTVRREVTYANPTQVIALTSRPSADARDDPGVMQVKAVLRDAEGELVPDGTPLQFLADRGRIARYHRTEHGAATAKWYPARDRPPAQVTATSGSATACAQTVPSPAGEGSADQPDAPSPR